MRLLATLGALLLASVPLHSNAADVVGGATSVLLDTDTLASAAGLTFSSVSPDVGAGSLGAGSVAFSINPRDAETLPTTFSYDPADFLGSFSGEINHTGSVFFNMDAVEVGNFTIGFDGARVAGDASGFFVESTTGIAAILFDIESPSTLTPSAEELVIGANLLVSPEFGQFLLDNSLSSTNLAGAVVGQALVEAVVPEPASLLLVASLACGLVACRRRA